MPLRARRSAPRVIPTGTAVPLRAAGNAAAPSSTSFQLEWPVSPYSRPAVLMPPATPSEAAFPATLPTPFRMLPSAACGPEWGEQLISWVKRRDERVAYRVGQAFLFRRVCVPLQIGVLHRKAPRSVSLRIFFGERTNDSFGPHQRHQRVDPSGLPCRSRSSCSSRRRRWSPRPFFRSSILPAISEKLVPESATGFPMSPSLSCLRPRIQSNACGQSAALRRLLNDA